MKPGIFTKRTTQWARATWIVTAIALWCVWPTGPVFADPLATYHVEKTFLGDISDGKGNVVAGPLTGSYRYLTHAFAEDKHRRDHNNDSPQTGALFGPLAERLVPGGGSNNATVRDSDHMWTAVNSFDQAAVGPQRFGPFQSKANSIHPDSVAKVTLDYTQQPGPNLGVGRIILDGKATITNLPLHPPETAYAEAKSAGEIKITGKVLGADIVDGKKLIPIRIKQGQTSLQSVGGSRAVQIDNPPGTPGLAGSASRYRDPLSLSFFDEVTGGLVSSNDLFTEDWFTEGDASIGFDDTTGLSLIGEIGGSAAITFATLSSWVLNPFNGGVSIVNGAFSATGDLASLPWIVSTVGGQTMATLMPGDLNLDFQFMVEATGLGSPTHDLLTVLSADGQGLADVYETASEVPEPSTFVLFGMGACGLLGRRRRSRKQASLPVRIAITT